MGTLFSALDIARSGMQVAQVQLDIAGHNIANVNKVGFSRQRVELLSRVPLSRPFGQIGRGVAIGLIARVRDPFLDTLIRNEVAGLRSAELQTQFYGQIEDIFLEPTEGGMSGRINSFFQVLQEFSTNVESLPIRQSVVTESESLAALFNDTARRLNTLRTNANEEVIGLVPEVNSLAERIAKLNDQIRVAESGGNPANDLRDARDVLLDELAGIVNIFTRERTDGQVDVLIGDQVLVNGDRSRELETVQNALLDPNRNDLVDIRFVDNGNLLTLRDGTIFGALELRDSILVEIQADIDLVAATIIREINVVHSQGSGLSNLTSLTGSNVVTDATLALNAAGLPFTVTPGTFEVTVLDAAGNPTAGSPTTITIGAGTSLNDLVADLNAIPDLTASVTPDGALSITAAAGFSFTFSNDTTGVLAALGANVLFTGSDAASMGVNQVIVDDPQLLTSGFSTDPNDTGDNSAALAMAEVQNGLFLQNASMTINDFFESSIVQIGIDARSVQATFEVELTFVDGFERRRQEVSGVSLDEEVTLLLQFQRAFEASARVVTVADRMLASLLAMAL